MSASGDSRLNRDERRALRSRVCCRVDVRQRYSTWSAVTEELSARGCRIVTTQSPRLGASLNLTLSSDLLPEDLDVVGEVVWINRGRIGVVFEDAPSPRRNGSLSPADWVRRLIEQGRDPGSSSELLVPAVQSAGRRVANRRARIVPISFGDRRRSS
jgi:PilZ domain-containing protein